MTELSRRDFLKVLGLGTAGAASTLALASCTSGGDTTTGTTGGTTAGTTGGTSTGTTDVATMETTTQNDLTATGALKGNVTKGADAADRTLVVVAAKTFETLDPFYATGAMAQRQYTLMFTPLWDLEYGKGEDVGVGVKSFSFEDDDTTVVFELHDNIVDNEGNNYTMDDLLWYYNKYTGELGKKLADTLSIEKLDTYKGKIKMKLKYYPGYLSIGKFPSLIFTQKGYESRGDEGFRTDPVGTARYKCIDFISGSSATFEQTYQYWGDPSVLLPHRAANVDFIRFDIITEEAQIANALRSGEIQAYDIQVSTAEDFLNNPGNITVHKYPSLYPSFLEFNMYPGSIFSDNLALRQAIAYGINWDDVAYAATMGYGSATGVIGHSGLAGYNTDWETDGTAWHYDPELAKQKLAEAGYQPGELTIKFTYNQTPNDFAVMQEYLKQIGINLEMDLLDEVTYMAKRGQANTLEWDIMGMDVVPKGFITNIFYNMCNNADYEWGQVNGANDQELHDLATAARYGTQEDIDKCYHALVERCWFIPRFNGNSFIGSYNKIEQVVVNSSQELIGQASIFADDYDVYY